MGFAWPGVAGLAVAQEAPAPQDAPDDWKPLFKESFSLLEKHCLYEIKPDTMIRSMLRILEKRLPPASAKAVANAGIQLKPEALFVFFGQAIEGAAGRVVGGPIKVTALMQSILQEYARSLDRYSDYILPEDHAILKALEAAHQVGLGFILDETKKGVFQCIPLPAQAAELAGLLPGDQLLAIDGKPTGGMSRYKVAALSLGKEGTTALINVQSHGKAPREVEIERAVIANAPIQIQQVGGETTIRILRFVDQTARDIHAVLLQLPPGGNLIIDLRGCPGGELEAAIACASHFLSEGKEVCRTVTRDKEDIRVSKNKSPFRAGRLVLLQNEGTASAGELLIAALTADPAARAVSRGPVTYGKGMTQTEFALKAGGALKFTDSRLLGPGGQAWEGIGLSPTQPN